MAIFVLHFTHNSVIQMKNRTRSISALNMDIMGNPHMGIMGNPIINMIASTRSHAAMNQLTPICGTMEKEMRHKGEQK